MDKHYGSGTLAKSIGLVKNKTHILRKFRNVKLKKQ